MPPCRDLSAFAAAVAGLDEGACKSALMAASFGLDCQLRVYETVKGMCAWVRGCVLGACVGYV